MYDPPMEPPGQGEMCRALDEITELKAENKRLQEELKGYKPLSEDEINDIASQVSKQNRLSRNAETARADSDDKLNEFEWYKAGHEKCMELKWDEITELKADNARLRAERLNLENELAYRRSQADELMKSELAELQAEVDLCKKSVDKLKQSLEVARAKSDE